MMRIGVQFYVSVFLAGNVSQDVTDLMLSFLHI